MGLSVKPVMVKGDVLLFVNTIENVSDWLSATAAWAKFLEIVRGDCVVICAEALFGIMPIALVKSLDPTMVLVRVSWN